MPKVYERRKFHDMRIRREIGGNHENLSVGRSSDLQRETPSSRFNTTANGIIRQVTAIESNRRIPADICGSFLAHEDNADTILIEF